jgi:hypothetical protein
MLCGCELCGGGEWCVVCGMNCDGGLCGDALVTCDGEWSCDDEQVTCDGSYDGVGSSCGDVPVIYGDE